MNLKDKKILITGGSGFVGMNLITRLQKEGANVENYDISNGNRIENSINLLKFVKKQFDIIYHLAGFSGSSESNKDIQKSFEINTLSTVNLLNMVTKFSPKTKIIFSSSRLEYGKPVYLPVDENHPTQPISAYGLSKLCATQVALIYHKIHNLDVTIFRTSNVYGPHPYAKFSGYNIVNHFIDLAKQNKTLTIFGEGAQIREYLYIDDFIDAIILASTPKSAGQIYNLGYGKGIKLKEIAKLIIKTVSKGKVKVVKWPKNYQEVETGDYVSDISKIENDLDFKPKIDFQTGIGKTLKLGIRN